jgi:hypothetical protein
MRQITRQVAPVAAIAVKIKNGIDYFPPTNADWSALLFWSGQ